MITNVRSKMKPGSEKSAAEFQQAAESLIEASPDLTDVEKRLLLEKAFTQHIAARRQKPSSKIAKNDIEQARKLTSFATAVSGAVSAGLVASLLIPSLPELVIAGIGLVGLLGSKLVARGIDKLTEK